MNNPCVSGMIFRRAQMMVLFFLFTAAVFAQSGLSLSAEIQNIERITARQDISPLQRHDAFIALAQLRQLSGDIEVAARNWLEAAVSIPGSADDEALLNCAYCLAAMGEWDRASAALEPLLLRYKRARFLYVSINAIKTGDLTELGFIADNPEYTELKPEIIFILWKISPASSSERWRRRLINEFPLTPEGLLAAGRSSSITVRPSPFWLFAGALIPLEVSQSGAQSISAASSSQNASSQTAVSAQTASRLQTGVFSRYINAQTQITNLIKAGFSASIERRVSGGNEMWAVTVPAGFDANRTMAELRAAGFDAFTLR